MNQLKLTPLFLNASKRIAEAIKSRSLFPLNVNMVNVTEFYQAISRHVEFLRVEIKKAENAKLKINSLHNVEENLVNEIKKLEFLGMFYEKFWEEKIPQSLNDKKIEIMQRYSEISESLQQEIDDFHDFNKIVDKSEMIRLKIEELSKKTRKLFFQYEDLFESIKRYLKASSTFIERFKDNVIPKLVKSDKRQIEVLLKFFTDLYEETLFWLEEMLNSISEKTTHISDLPKTRRTIFEEERKLREALIKEIKDLDEQETLILMKIVEALAFQKASWLPLTEICKIITQQIDIPLNKVKEIVLNISEKGFLSLAAGF